jgi:hypothetical protein
LPRQVPQGARNGAEACINVAYKSKSAALGHNETEYRAKKEIVDLGSPFGVARPAKRVLLSIIQRAVRLSREEKLVKELELKKERKKSVISRMKRHASGS